MSTHTHTYALVTRETREDVAGELVRVVRKPTETDAYFLAAGHHKVQTANGPIKVQGPVWILWDQEGSPYPITPDEFARIYEEVYA